MEFWGGVTRYEFDAIVSEQDLADTYLPAFRSCVTRGGASCIMCAYNAVNGVPMCANKPFLTGIAREKWGFDGYITSDCDAVENVWDAHNYTETLTETIGVVMEAGMDIDCGSAMTVTNLKAALLDDAVSEGQLDAALRNLFSVQYRLGMFDPGWRQPDRQITPAAIDTAAHRQLALEAARQSLVLLKNGAGALPLQRGRTLAMVGPHANATDAMQSNYFGTPPFLVSPLQGAARYAAAVAYSPGCDVLCNTTEGFAAAAQAAAGADAVVVALGLLAIIAIPHVELKKHHVHAEPVAEPGEGTDGVVEA